MIVEPFLDEGLGNGSYLLGVATGKAVLIDPDRRIARYLRRAEDLGVEIVGVLDTHLHADFVSGSLDVARATGAEVVVPSGAGVGFDHRRAIPGERLAIADVELEVRATPGHSPEHVSYVARVDGRDADVALFSGGALIAGGAARTDLVSPDATDRLTREQFRSVREAFEDLPDATMLYPTHGGGSFCSAGGGGPHVSTLGTERRSNPILRFPGDADAFAAWWPTTFPSIPTYFERMRDVNRAGPRPRETVAPPPPLDPLAFDRVRREPGVIVVDARHVDAYGGAHIEGSIAIPFRESYPTWLGWLVPGDARLLFVADETDLAAIVESSLLVGYESFAGWLCGGLEAWIDENMPIRSTPSIGPNDAVPWLEMGAHPVDVREEDEFELGHVAGATHVPLGSLERRSEDLPPGRPLLVYCASGQRSTSATSILERRGIGPVVHLRGGYGAWRHLHRD
ncbi:MAG TPA: rhodanese-like domain-containing protein [Actinomycetota bacterium]|nr:rhodanese-like domain-containing protein [Actinomycetota bacterium]